MQAWHLTEGRTLRNGNPLPDVVERIEHTGKAEIVGPGLHAARTIIAAASFGPAYATMLHYVDIKQVVKEQNMIVVGNDRQILWSIEAVDIFRSYMCELALETIHYWSRTNHLKVIDYLQRHESNLKAWKIAWNQNGGNKKSWHASRIAAWALFPQVNLSEAAGHYIELTNIDTSDLEARLLYEVKEQRIKEATTQLKQLSLLEWDGGYKARCPKCRGYRTLGHENGCSIFKALYPELKRGEEND